MKKWLTAAILLLALTGCGVSTALPDDPVVYQQAHGDGYLYLRDGDKKYVPYCPFRHSYMGECIGYYDTEADAYTESSRVYVYAFKGYSPEEWIVEYDPEINEGMVMRELRTKTVPEGLTSEYEWNQ